MAVARLLLMVLVCAVFHATIAYAALPAGSEPSAIVWKRLVTGLDLARVVLSFPSQDNGDAALVGVFGPAGGKATATLLRIEPEHVVFTLHMASEKGFVPLADVAVRDNLVAAINAGMFQQDHITGTGYLKNASHTNNARVAANYGAFFVAEPYSKEMPRARLIDRHEGDWQRTIAEYGIVMQNYRMNSLGGEVLWKRRDRLHSMSVLSQDIQGRVYFIFCPDMVQGTDFAAELLKLPLQLRTIMYLEGGSEAALLVRAGDVDRVETGRHLWGKGLGLSLPNILGVRLKKINE